MRIQRDRYRFRRQLGNGVGAGQRLEQTPKKKMNHKEMKNRFIFGNKKNETNKKKNEKRMKNGRRPRREMQLGKERKNRKTKKEERKEEEKETEKEIKKEYEEKPNSSNEQKATLN